MRSLARDLLRLAVVATGLWGMPCAVTGAEETTRAKPNIIYINADDLGWADLSCQGSTYYESPNIDRLAKQGMRFTDAYAPAANCAMLLMFRACKSRRPRSLVGLVPSGVITTPLSPKALHEAPAAPIAVSRMGSVQPMLEKYST